MKFIEQFKPGDNVKVFLSKDSKAFYNAKILQMNGEENSFDIEFIAKELIVGDRISIKKESKEHIFVFCTKVIKSTKGDFRITLEIPTDVSRLNKKEFFSLPLNLEIGIKNSKNLIYSAQSNEISDIGLSLGMNSILNVDEPVELTIPFHKDFTLEHVKGIVKKVENGKNSNFKYFIVFDSLENSVKEQILVYIFKVQKILLQISKNM